MTTHYGERQVREAHLRDLVSSTGRTPGATGDDAIVVEALAKRYPSGTDAVRGVSFR